METVIGNRKFNGGTHIVAILNVTPDSFSDGGKYLCRDNVLRRCEEMISQGAEIIDIGGESTRPLHTPIDENEEIERVIPFLRDIKENFDIPVSVDTYKYEVAHQALLNGADMINDIWGFKKSPEIANLVREHNASCCLMHNRKTAVYNDFFSDLLDDLRLSIGIAKDSGIDDCRIIIDAGVGFAKNTAQNLEALKRTADIEKTLGYPVMTAVSRKSVIGNVLEKEVGDRLCGTLATSAYAYFCGARFLRVHDISENKQIIDMLDAIKKGSNYNG